MKLPNIITLSRVPFLFIIVTLIYWSGRGAPTAAFVLFIIASLSDWLDGYLARKYNMVSVFGKLMDALIDKILMVGLFVALLTKHLLPEWALFLVLIVLGREFLVTGLRLVAASHGKVLEAEKSGKQKTLTQIIAMGILLFAYAAKTDWHGYLCPAFIHFADDLGIVSFVIATLWTVKSGTNYFLKYKHLLE